MFGDIYLIQVSIQFGRIYGKQRGFERVEQLRVPVLTIDYQGFEIDTSRRKMRVQSPKNIERVMEIEKLDRNI